MCICGAILIAIGGAVAFVLTYRAPVADTAYHAPAKKAPKTAEKYYSHLNGIEVASKADLSKPVTAIMIENSPDARPHSGLKQAEVVYEAIAEGGSYEDAAVRLLAAYPQLDTAQLQEALGRVLFVADLWGQIGGR